MLPAAVGVEETSVGQVDAARDMAGHDAGPWLRFAAAEARGRAGVDHLLGMACEIGLHLFDRADPRAVRTHAEYARGRIGCAGIDPTPLGTPFRKAAVQNCGVDA